MGQRSRVENFKDRVVNRGQGHQLVPNETTWLTPLAKCQDVGWEDTCGKVYKGCIRVGRAGMKEASSAAVGGV